MTKFNQSTEVRIDPTGHFKEIDKNRILEVCGLIPMWMMPHSDMPMKELLDVSYGYGLFEMKGGKVGRDMVYRYPEDPELYPLIKIVRNGETLLQYEHAIIVIIDAGGEAFVTRCD